MVYITYDEATLGLLLVPRHFSPAALLFSSDGPHVVSVRAALLRMRICLFPINAPLRSGKEFLSDFAGSTKAVHRSSPAIVYHRCIVDMFKQEGYQMYCKVERLLFNRDVSQGEVEEVLKFYEDDWIKTHCSPSFTCSMQTFQVNKLQAYMMFSLL